MNNSPRIFFGTVIRGSRIPSCPVEAHLPLFLRAWLSFLVLIFLPAASVISSQNIWTTFQGYLFGLCNFFNFRLKLLFDFSILFVIADGFNSPKTHFMFFFAVATESTSSDSERLSSGCHPANLHNQSCLFQSSNIHPIPRIKNLFLQFCIRHQTITMK